MINLSIYSTRSHQVRFITILGIYTDQVETYYSRTGIFKNSFFANTIDEWNKLDFDAHKSKSYATFYCTVIIIQTFVSLC